VLSAAELRARHGVRAVAVLAGTAYRGNVAVRGADGVMLDPPRVVDSDGDIGPAIAALVDLDAVCIEWIDPRSARLSGGIVLATDDDDRLIVVVE
jgi:hypothetical protein